MSNLKQSLLAIYITNRRMINLGACVGIIIANLMFAIHNKQLEQQLLDMTQTYNHFKPQYDEVKKVNIRIKAMYDNLQYQYDELANGSYCINEIVEGGE